MEYYQNFIIKNQFEIILLSRIFFSCLCGLIIGYERENKNKSAGIRTHIIVALGACLAVIISKYGFLESETTDTSRIASQVISGIGFLGAGVILIKNSTISGLATAAGIWTTSIIGMSFAVGMYTLGFVCTIITLLVEIIFCKTDLNYIEKKDIITLKINELSALEILEKYIKKNNMKCNYLFREYKNNTVNIKFEYFFKNDDELNDFLLFLSTIKNINDFEIKHIF